MAKREGFCFRLVMNMTAAATYSISRRRIYTNVDVQLPLHSQHVWLLFSQTSAGLPPILPCQSFFYAVDPHSNVSIFNDKRNVPCQLGKPEIRGEKLNCTIPNEITAPFPLPFSYFFGFQNEDKIDLVGFPGFQRNYI